MDTACTLTSDDGVVDIGYGAAIADEGITFAMAGDKNTMTVGADGEGMHSLHCDKSGQVTVRLLKASPTNAKLMNLYNIQQSSTAKWGKNTITMNHSGSGDNYTATKCAFKKPLIIRMQKMDLRSNGFLMQSKLILSLAHTHKVGEWKI